MKNEEELAKARRYRSTPVRYSFESDRVYVMERADLEKSEGNGANLGVFYPEHVGYH